VKKLLSIILSIAMLFSVTTVAFANNIVECAEDTTQPQEVKVIKVGINAEFPPFEYYENGNLTGFDIELMNTIGERIGYNIEYIEFPFDRLLPAVASGEVDCAISAISVTKERDGVVDYTRAYLEAAVTYKDGEEATEQYAIVFSENSVNKARLIEASGDPFPSMYMLVDKAIKELAEDGTVEKLIRQYELENEIISDLAEYKYYSVKEAEEIDDKDIPKYESWEEIGLTSPYPSEWAAKDIDFAYEFGITDSTKQYSYHKPITREEFCELIYNYCYNVIKEVDTLAGENKFTDTTNSNIIRLNAMGIINGKTATEFAPDDLLTREEAAVILTRMVNATAPVEVTQMWFEFDDAAYISDWAMDSVQTMCNMKVMNGVGENSFAPKESYTTEQAIVTITRVYSAQHNKAENEKAQIEPEKITVTDITKLADFYVDEAIKLTKESGELASDREFVGYYTANEEMLEKVLALGNYNYSTPREIYYIAADREKTAENIKAMLGEDAKDFDMEKLLRLNRVNLSALASLINASYGAENLAAMTMIANAEGYIMPKDFKNDFALYLEYDGEYSAFVSFSKFGEGVISANMSFVKNGEKDNIFSRLYEITQGLGEGCMDIARVKRR